MGSICVSFFFGTKLVEEEEERSGQTSEVLNSGFRTCLNLPGYGSVGRVGSGRSNLPHPDGLTARSNFLSPCNLKAVKAVSV